MESSRRAVEAYWRSRMVDAVTSDEDKVAPVYKLEEICDLLRASDGGIVREVSDFILKRLDHKSPVVKQKALRLVKYAVGKSGAEFRREMQRHSGAMRQLVHYKGQPDPLKGDALNKGVRETAQEAISAIFASDDNKTTTPTESLNKRIQGFGNTNFEMPTEEKKSFLSEVVGIGSASIMQGLSIASAHVMKKNDTGGYKGPTLRRSLTTENDGRDRYARDDQNAEYQPAGMSNIASSGTWTQDLRMSTNSSGTVEDASTRHAGIKSREERLLETIVTSGGLRLQPTRDSLQSFLVEASKLDAVSMSHAIEMKLQSHLWQVRMKAICVLESICRKKDDEHFSIIVSYFFEKRDSLEKCLDLPQVSLREKAIKVLNLLDGVQVSGTSYKVEPSNSEDKLAPVVELQDLIDTSDLDDLGTDASHMKLVEESVASTGAAGSLANDPFGGSLIAELNSNPVRTEDDPFSDVVFHNTETKEVDIFSGLTVANGADLNGSKPMESQAQLQDIFGTHTESTQERYSNKNNVHDLMSGLFINGTAQDSKPHVELEDVLSGSSHLSGSGQPAQLGSNDALNSMLEPNMFKSMGPLQYSMPPNIMLNHVYAAQPMNYAAQPMNYAAFGTFVSQQQMLFQNLGNLSSGFGQAPGNIKDDSYSTPLPDIFQLSNKPVLRSDPMMSSSKKEETKAFDFISDHLTAARDSKRLL